MDTDTLTLDSALRLLSHTRRRALVKCLDEYDEPLALADAAKYVAESEFGTPSHELSGKTVKRVYITLYHAHVPKLRTESLVTHDQDRELIALTDRGEQLAAYLHHFSDDMDRPMVT